MDADALEDRKVAIAALDAILAGEIDSPDALRRAWPLDSGDMLVRRAFQDAMHYLEAGWDVTGRFLRHHKRFLEEGGSIEEQNRVFDDEASGGSR
ncbi:MAG: hypothetical protein QNJ98_04550 [Planctomycetota bacterium]|nr:hypothetical protein [Planctomycetota bacterium]